MRIDRLTARPRLATPQSETRHGTPAGRFRRTLAAALLGILTLASSLVTTAGPAAAHPHSRVEIIGGGWGHGRGMGQYGALGYARDHGWNSRQILDHYYGGTTQGPAPSVDYLDPDHLRVQLAYMNGRTPTITLAQGRMVLVDAAGNRLRTVPEPALRLVPSSGGYEVQVGTGCGGPWQRLTTVSASAVGVRVEADPGDNSVIGGDSKTLLGVCGPSHRTWYDGEIWAHRTRSGIRSVNVVTIEQYLRGVVPNEVPASWPSAVLEAQAVAARSYALAGDRRWGSHADTCDNTYCQVYDGRVTTRGGTRSATHRRTDAAVAATAGQVRITSSGRIARTEFSSSTGGHTTGPSFTPVVDKGDATSANPNSSWSVSISLRTLENRYGLGQVKTIAVTKRDGHGRFGGRAKEVTIRFRDGTRTMTGSAFRIHFGLKSELYDFGPIQDDQPSAPVEDPVDEPVSDPPTDTTEEPRPVEAPTVDRADKAVVELMFTRLAGRSPTAAELETWLDVFASDENEARQALAQELVDSDHFAGALVDGLYRATLGRAADERGRAYWVARLTSGGRSQMTFEQVGAYFYGSAEYYRRAGNTDRAFIGRLYRDLLGRPADPGGLDYWVDALDESSTSDVVASFFRSEESRRTRAADLHLLVTGRAPSRADLAEGADILARSSHLELAVRWAASLEP